MLPSALTGLVMGSFVSIGVALVVDEFVGDLARLTSQQVQSVADPFEPLQERRVPLIECVETVEELLLALVEDLQSGFELLVVHGHPLDTTPMAVGYGSHGSGYPLKRSGPVAESKAGHVSGPWSGRSMKS